MIDEITNTELEKLRVLNELSNLIMYTSKKDVDLNSPEYLGVKELLYKKFDELYGGNQNE